MRIASEYPRSGMKKKKVTENIDFTVTRTFLKTKSKFMRFYGQKNNATNVCYLKSSCITCENEIYSLRRAPRSPLNRPMFLIKYTGDSWVVLRQRFFRLIPPPCTNENRNTNTNNSNR